MGLRCNTISPHLPNHAGSSNRTTAPTGRTANVVSVVRRSRRLPAYAAVAISILTLCACGGAGGVSHPTTTASPPGAADYATTIRDRVTTDAMMAHLTALQHIADANGGNRAVGTPGYDASVNFVADALRSKGFDVEIPEFELRFPFADPPDVTVGATEVEAQPLEYTAGTPPQGVTGPPPRVVPWR